MTSQKIAPNAVRTAHVADGSLLVGDFKPGQIPQGPKGDKGDRGDRGPTGAPGLSGYEIVRASATVNANTNSSLQATCPAGKKVLGGAHGVGVNTTGVFYSATVFTVSTTEIYSVIIANTNGTPRTADVQAFCARVSE